MTNQLTKHEWMPLIEHMVLNIELFHLRWIIKSYFQGTIELAFTYGKPVMYSSYVLRSL